MHKEKKWIELDRELQNHSKRFLTSSPQMINLDIKQWIELEEHCQISWTKQYLESSMPKNQK